MFYTILDNNLNGYKPYCGISFKANLFKEVMWTIKDILPI
jgi:hypothetical protein